MLRILLHALVLPAMLWLERKHGPHLKPSRAALVWYALGVPLMIVEAADRVAILMQSLMIALFFVPPAYFTFRYAQKSRHIGRSFLLFLVLAAVAAVAAGFVLARAPVVRGFLGTP